MVGSGQSIDDIFKGFTVEGPFIAIEVSEVVKKLYMSFYFFLRCLFLHEYLLVLFYLSAFVLFSHYRGNDIVFQALLF